VYWRESKMTSLDYSFICTKCNYFDIDNIHSNLLRQLGKEDYRRIHCPECKQILVQCMYCAKNYTSTTGKTKTIANHIERCHSEIERLRHVSVSIGLPRGADADTFSPQPMDIDFTDNNVGTDYNDEGIDDCNVRNEGVEETIEIDLLLCNTEEEDEEELVEICNTEEEAEFVQRLIENEEDNNSRADTPSDVSESIEKTYADFDGKHISYDGFANFDARNSPYFYQNHMFGHLAGLKGLIWRAMNRRHRYSKQELCTDEDTRLMFNITSHLLNISGSEEDVFLDILLDISKRSSPNDQLTYPTTTEEANAICLSGKKFSIFANLPQVEVFDIDGHACISLNELLNHIMAHGIPIEDIDITNNDSTRINQSRAAQELRKRMEESNTFEGETLYYYLIFWSDGFLRSYIKQKDNSVWILTVTIADPKGNSTSAFHTFCLAIGRSKHNHTKVINYYIRELNKLRCGMKRYCARRRRMVNTCFDMLAYISDRPERSSILKTLHLGNTGKRSLYSAGIDPKNMPLCKNCFNALLQKVIRKDSTPLQPCAVCMQWDFQSTSQAAKKIPLPKDYPKSVADGSPPFPEHRTVTETCLLAHRQTFDWLRKGAALAEYNITHKHWQKKELETFIQCLALNEETKDAIWTKGRNNRGGVTDTQVYEPEIWSLPGGIDVCLDAPLHHIFHGIIPTVMKAIHEFMTEHSLASKFENHVNTYLSEIASMRLSWCKVKTLPKKLWLGEDVLGFSRVMPFIYSQFFLGIKMPESDIVANETLVAIKQMIHSMHVMVSVLMSPRDPCINTIDRAIKIFLSCCDRFVRHYYDDDTEPFWASTGNFPSLLNLPQQIEFFGPLRLYWEGVRERYIQSVKCVLKSMRKTTSYFQVKLTLIQKLTLMSWLQQQVRNTNQKARSDPGYYRYPNREEVVGKFKKGVPLSAFTLPNRPNKMYVAYGRMKSMVKYIEISFNVPNNAIEECGLYYANCQLSNSANDTEISTSELRTLVGSNCLMLPYQQRNRRFEHKYTMVFDDWDVIGQTSTKCILSLCEQLFRCDVAA